MPSLLTYFKKPEYVLRPSQAWKRIQRLWRKTQPVETVTLPWGAPLKIRIGEHVGNDIHYYGIHDKIVPEAIWRLLETGETALDIGANIGQNTSAMAYRAGPAGRVLAFEPHPEVYAELCENSRRWPAGRAAPVRLENVALGPQTGSITLAEGPDFGFNRGSAAVAVGNNEAPVGRTFAVNVRSLDSYLQEAGKVGVCKMDVEGYELSVLEGAPQILSQHAIRDLIFEDFNPMPSPVVTRLQENGYGIFRLASRWLKPELLPLSATSREAGVFTYNYLATLQPERAIARFRRGGWRCLTSV